MKTFKKLGQTGFAHHLALVVVVLAVAVGGTAYLVASHADTPTATVNLTTSTTPTLQGHVSVLGADQAVGAQVGPSSVPFSFIGTQTVASLAPGQSLSYSNGVKGNETSCYFFYVTQPKSGTATATVEFANNNNYVTKTVSSTDDNNLQVVCVTPGRKTNPGFEVANKTSLQQNTNVEVYQDVLYWN